ncbi:MAG TPA: PIN domain-containing protein [Casimicrobiaceae bacterium]
MAGDARYIAVLDACVLYPIAIADSLVSLATAGLYAAKWSLRIEEEWITALENNRPDLKGKLTTRRDCMREAIPDWEVPALAWEPVARCIKLPDPDDAHVLAAAIAGHADSIVTTNTRHFPDAVIKPYGIEAIHPDQFIINQWDLEPLIAVGAFKQMRARRRQPEASAEDFARALERNGLAATALRLREDASLI